MKWRRGGEWVAQNDVLLALPDTPLDRVYAAMLTSLIGEGARQVASAPNRRQANRTIEAVLAYARRLLVAERLLGITASFFHGLRATRQQLARHGEANFRAAVDV